MSVSFRSLIVLMATLSLVRCSSSSSSDTGIQDGAAPLDAQSPGPKDSGPRDTGAVDSGAVDSGAVDAAADAAAPDAIGQDAAPMDAAAPDATPDAGCVPPLANCNGSGLTCEVNTSTNSMNCGACGHSCYGAPCGSSLCDALAVAPRGSAFRSKLAHGDVYLTRIDAIPPSFHYIERASSLGTVEETIASGAGGPGGLEADADYIYFAIYGTPNSTVYRKSHTASATAAAEMAFQTMTLPNWMVIRGGTLYWLSASPNANMYKRAMNAPASDLGTQLTIEDEGNSVSGFTATSTTIYWVRAGGAAPRLRSFALTATAAADVPGSAMPQNGAAMGFIHTDANKVYWGVVGGSAPGIYSYYAGGSVTFVSASNNARLVFPDPASDQLYFGDPFFPSMLFKVSKRGGTGVAVGQHFYGYDVAGADATFLYGVGDALDSSSIYRMVK